MHDKRRKTVLITGSSRGIGRATALKFAEKGYVVAVNYHRSKKSAEEVIAEIKEKGGDALLAQADVSNIDAVKKMIMYVKSKCGNIDVLVNNAGIYERTDFFSLTHHKWQKTIDVNLTGIFNCCKAVVPIMAAQRYGRIINVSSILALKGSSRGAHYAASKAGIIGLTKSLAIELAPFNITVNAVAPGNVDTYILSSDTKAKRAERIKKIPLRRIGTTNEIADVILFLASDAANYITGEIITVDGGLSLT
jgi:3-oxoacyl-[acyl-carrier protein] reductase